MGALADQHFKAGAIPPGLLEPHSFKAAHEEFCWIEIDLNFPGERKKI